MINNKRTSNYWVMTPFWGTIIFVVLYIIATRFYPGGSQVDHNSIGFSWINNYWCNLLMENAINGQPNPAKPIAMAGMFVLCLTLSIFWLILPQHLNTGKISKLIIQISGTLSMVIAFFLFSNINHDLVTNLASGFGLIATIGTFVELYRIKWNGLLSFGLVNILLVIINNYFYYNKNLIIHLPLIQKISFSAFLIWICTICIALKKQLEVKNKDDKKELA